MVLKHIVSWRTLEQDVANWLHRSVLRCDCFTSMDRPFCQVRHSSALRTTRNPQRTHQSSSTHTYESTTSLPQVCLVLRLNCWRISPPAYRFPVFRTTMLVISSSAITFERHGSVPFRTTPSEIDEVGSGRAAATSVSLPSQTSSIVLNFSSWLSTSQVGSRLWQSWALFPYICATTLWSVSFTDPICPVLHAQCHPQ